MEDIFVEPNNSVDTDPVDLEELLDQLPPPLRRHSRRVAVCSAIIAEYADKRFYSHGLSGMNLATSIHLGGTCHDIGKIAFPAIALAAEDYYSHPVRGVELLKENEDEIFTSEAQAKIVKEIVHWHHEQANGNGFPDGLKAKDIPLATAICTIANELDHLLYNESGANSQPRDMNDVFMMLKEQSGNKFCGAAVLCFEQAWPQLMDLYREWNQTE